MSFSSRFSVCSSSENKTLFLQGDKDEAMEKETLFRGKEMWAPFPSRDVSIYMREIAQIG